MKFLRERLDRDDPNDGFGNYERDEDALHATKSGHADAIRTFMFGLLLVAAAILAMI